MGRRRLFLCAPFVLAAGQAACSQPSDVQPYPGTCAPFQALSFHPPGLAENVPTNVTLGVTFSDYPDPETVNGGGMLLTSGIFWHTGIYTVDLVTKTVRFRPPVPLRPELSYTLTVFPALRSLQGCATTLAQRSFRTADQASPPAPAPPTTSFAAVLPILEASCAGAGCHRDAPENGASGCLEAPARGLSLCDAHAYEALVDKPSREVSRLRLVVPRDSSRSYLLRKLLPASGDSGAPVPTTPGHRDPPGSMLDPQALRTIADWIDTGAVR